MAVDGPTDVDLRRVAHAYLDHWLPERIAETAPVDPIDLVARARLNWDEEYCRRVANQFQSAPRMAYGSALRRRYDRFKQENLQQYQAITAAGIAIVPWLAAGQPYDRSTELRRSVRTTGVLHVYLSSSGHGPGTDPDHPMLAPSGVVAGGVEFSHNDVFRAVHDVFGHVMLGNSFSPQGEFRASHCHLRMYSDEAQPVLFTEQIAQVCWFFFGPHLAAGAPREYPAQKVVEFPYSLLAEFTDLFDLEQ